MMNLSFQARIGAFAVKVIFIGGFFAGVMHEAKSQTASDTLNLDQPIFGKVEEQPEYPGGYAKMMTFLRKKMTYPKAAVRQRIEGTVYVAFVVDEEGRVIDVRTLRGISRECDAEAERVVRLMPKWKPGKLDGKPVPVRFVMPIMFKGRAKWTKGS
jgi:protein TonB